MIHMSNAKNSPFFEEEAPDRVEIEPGCYIVSTQGTTRSGNGIKETVEDIVSSAVADTKRWLAEREAVTKKVGK